MSERTIPEPLSGSEIVDRITHKVKQMLLQDCYLNPIAAYGWFSCGIHIEMIADDAGREVEVKIDVKEETSPTVPENSTRTQADGFIEKAPPNQVRQDSDQRVPAVVHDSQGNQKLERIKYGTKK
jgi:hypothetical protein